LKFILKKILCELKSIFGNKQTLSKIQNKIFIKIENVIRGVDKISTKKISHLTLAATSIIFL